MVVTILSAMVHPFRHFSLLRTLSVKPPTLFRSTGARAAPVMSAGLHMLLSTRGRENAAPWKKMEPCAMQIATRFVLAHMHNVHAQSTVVFPKSQNAV